jgi:hypothetical protein
MSTINRNGKPDKTDFSVLEFGDRRKRRGISAAKQPFLDAVVEIINNLEEFWPLSDRRIHYVLLDDPPLRHGGKPDTR